MKVKRNILLNPGPATTTDSVKMAMVVPDICPREKEFGDLMKEVREGIIKIVASPETHTAVLFTCSGTGAVEACVSSAVPAGGKILIVINGAYGTRMAEIARRYYGDERVCLYELPFGTFPDPAELDKRLKADKEITTVGVIHHETTSGMLNPIREMGKAAHDNGCEIIVDAMSSFAGVDINMVRDNADYLISSSNKNIQGMAGLSFVILSFDTLRKTGNNEKKNLYFNLLEQHEYFDKSGQMRYTPPVQIVYALKQAIDEFEAETAQGRYNRYASSWKTLMEGMAELGFSTLLPEEYQSGLLTTFFDPKDDKYSFDEMHDYLYERGFTIYPGKISSKDTFRLANIGQIDSEDIKDFIKVLGEYIDENNIKVS